MIKHTMKSRLPSATAVKFYDFMIDPPPETYARWLPDEHHEFHVVKYSSRTPIGDLVFFDQNIGKKHRLKFYAIIRVADKTKHILYQMRRYGISLPGYLELDLHDTVNGLVLTETIHIGYDGFGKFIDPVIRLFFNESFFKEMNEHHKREWANLAEML